MERIYERLNDNRTISNMRRCRFIENERYDRLDLALSSTYNHCRELFPDEKDYYLQKETKSKGVWGPSGFIFKQPQTKDNSMGHPIKYGGVPERRSPHNVKLMNSSHHSAKTAPGYSRPFGGTLYYY
ncbi:uncharacterized protein LOC143910804 [Arctopsyche grandis]|uniref:uncharacterized protein LOC143910804 n=1 Tax=Arctopsyche grandis TaxID=121162 RepID=UPI00406D8436